AEFYGDNMAQLWRLLRGGGGVQDDTSSSSKLLKEFNDILHGLGARTTARAASGGLLLLRMFSGMHAALPCPASVLQLLSSPADAGGIHQSRDAHFFKFMNPVWREVVVPTEVGVPVLGVIRTPTLVYQKGRYQMEYSAQQQQQQQQRESPAGWKNNAKISFLGNTTLARSSWQEESSSMSSFLSSLVRSVAYLTSPAWQQQRQYATDAQALMRPVLSYSHQSFLSILETFTHPPMLEVETHMGWLLNMNTLLPDDLFLSLNAKMNSVRVPLLQVNFKSP
ncbi:hypothetical protein FHG87_019409, partial [Trinorchestia longiramus]